MSKAATVELFVLRQDGSNEDDPYLPGEKIRIRVKTTVNKPVKSPYFKFRVCGREKSAVKKGTKTLSEERRYFDSRAVVLGQRSDKDDEREHHVSLPGSIVSVEEEQAFDGNEEKLNIGNYSHVFSFTLPHHIPGGGAEPLQSLSDGVSPRISPVSKKKDAFGLEYFIKVKLCSKGKKIAFDSEPFSVHTEWDKVFENLSLSSSHHLVSTDRCKALGGFCSLRAEIPSNCLVSGQAFPLHLSIKNEGSKPILGIQGRVRFASFRATPKDFAHKGIVTLQKEVVSVCSQTADESTSEESVTVFQFKHLGLEIEGSSSTKRTIELSLPSGLLPSSFHTDLVRFSYQLQFELLGKGEKPTGVVSSINVKILKRLPCQRCKNGTYAMLSENGVSALQCSECSSLYITKDALGKEQPAVFITGYGVDSEVAELQKQLLLEKALLIAE